MRCLWEHNEKSMKINHVYATVKRESVLKIMLLNDTITNFQVFIHNKAWD